VLTALRAALTIPPRWRGRVRAGLQLGVVVGAVYGTLAAARGAWAYATTSPRFEVKHLVASPTDHVDDAHLRELLALEPGTNILSLDLDELSARVTADPWVAKAAVTRELPDTLHVEVIEHDPRVVVLAERLYLADARGVLFKRADGRERGDLPIVTGIDRRLLVDPSPQVREQARARVLQAIGVLDAWERKHRPRLAEIHVAEYGDITLFTAETGAQIRLGRGDHEARLARYDALRAALREQADDLAVVHIDSSARPGDVDRVVVRFFDERHARAAMSLTPPRDEAPAPAAEPGENPGAPASAAEGAAEGAAPSQDTSARNGKQGRSRKKLIPRAR
jgi:cell division protein FtsQ